MLQAVGNWKGVVGWCKGYRHVGAELGVLLEVVGMRVGALLVMHRDVLSAWGLE